MAVFNINTFRASLGAGGSRPNQFMVKINTPPSGAVDPAISQISSFLVSSASLPGQTIGTASVFYRGRELKLAGDRTYTAWATTFINDRDLYLRSQIESWMNSMDHLTDKNGFTQPLSYFADLTVDQLDRNGVVIHSYLLRGAWPTDLSDIGLDFGSNDTISTTTCTWNYQEFVINPTGQKEPVGAVPTNTDDGDTGAGGSLTGTFSF